MGKLSAAILVLLVICLVIAAICLADLRLGPWLGVPLLATGRRNTGGAAPRRSRAAARSAGAHVVVDTLNLAHWLLKPGPGQELTITPEVIVRTIDLSAGELKRRWAGRVMYVLKDRESQFNVDSVRETYRQAAVRNAVYVSVAERYADPPSGAQPSAEHSSRGRDDFYMSLLAFRHRCAVLTADKLHDFGRFRATIPPFHVVEFAFWRERPHREFIKPDSPAYARIRKPRTISPATVLSPATTAAG